MKKRDTRVQSKDKPIKKNPAYEHVQPKLYNATVSHDIKQNAILGRPPTTGKAKEII